MTIKELKQHEASLLSTSNKNLRIYGKAYSEIIKKYNQYSGFSLSDSVLLSDIAKEYIKEQKSYSDFIKNSDFYIQKINAASKLIIKDILSIDETLDVIRSVVENKIVFSYKDVVPLVEGHYLYEKISPTAFIKAFEIFSHSQKSD